jgi:choline dehydrogenase-like flavoprotein
MIGEPAPNPRSRVTLAGATDSLGVRKVRLNWELTDLDQSSAMRSMEAIARALGQRGPARLHNHALVDKRFWSTVTGGSHHLGTTRMHQNPRHGVVDANCRVHGISNLYVAGSGVFPNAGISNPTLTIVALALRLAKRLKGGGA